MNRIRTKYLLFFAFVVSIFVVSIVHNGIYKNPTAERTLDRFLPTSKIIYENSTNLFAVPASCQNEIIILNSNKEVINTTTVVSGTVKAITSFEGMLFAASLITTNNITIYCDSIQLYTSAYSNAFFLVVQDALFAFLSNTTHASIVKIYRNLTTYSRDFINVSFYSAVQGEGIIISYLNKTSGRNMVGKLDELYNIVPLYSMTIHFANYFGRRDNCIVGFSSSTIIILHENATPYKNYSLTTPVSALTKGRYGYIVSHQYGVSEYILSDTIEEIYNIKISGGGLYALDFCGSIIVQCSKLTHIYDIDVDNDGLKDSQELRIGTNPQNPDTDGDTLLDLQEITIGTNPLSKDTDDDLLRDDDELEIGTDPLNPDTDCDGLTDGAEIYYYRSDPLNPDTDGDLIPDGTEVALGIFGNVNSMLKPYFVAIIFIIVLSIAAIYLRLKNKHNDEAVVLQI